MMNSDSASLDQLYDIVEPAPVSWWPLAPGWWVVLILSGIMIVVFSVRAWKSWQRDAYRRAALRALQSTSTLAEIMEILKRTALVTFPREDVASLTGTAWCNWLSETSNLRISSSLEQLLCSTLFQKSSHVKEIEEVQSFAVSWIQNHRQSTK